ncbi:MAG: hypothetical protein ABIN55_01970 [Aeromicrobium sp.]
MTYTPGAFQLYNDAVIGPMSRCSIAPRLGALNFTTPVDALWPTANLAFYIPFVLERTVTVYQVGWVNAATAVTGTHEAGVYDSLGSKIISGAAAGSGLSAVQVVNVTDTVLSAGQYWIAMVNTSTVGHVWAWAPTAPQAASLGVLTEATAGTLPTTATMAISQTSAFIPICFLQMRATL